MQIKKQKVYYKTCRKRGLKMPTVKKEREQLIKTTINKELDKITLAMMKNYDILIKLKKDEVKVYKQKPQSL